MTFTDETLKIFEALKADGVRLCYLVLTPSWFKDFSTQIVVIVFPPTSVKFLEILFFNTFLKN